MSLTPYAKETCQEMVNKYIEAEKAVLQSKSYTIGDRTLSRENLPEIIKGRTYWEQQLAYAIGSTTGARVKRVVIRDD